MSSTSDANWDISQPVRSRQVMRKQLSTAAFSKVPPQVPRKLKRQWARLATKVAHRESKNRWEYPLTQADLTVNNLIRANAVQLQAAIEPFMQELPQVTLA